MKYCPMCGNACGDGNATCSSCGASLSVAEDGSQNVGYRPEIQGKSANSKYMSSTELWSWLKQSSKRQLFYTRERSSLTEDQFMDKIKHKMEENGVPANIVKKTIEWDCSNVRRDNFFVEPVAEEANPIACLVQFNHVGNFSFVEEKTFIMPPNLPDVPAPPMQEREKDKESVKFFSICGILALLVGLFVFKESVGIGVLLLAVGIVMLCFAWARHERCAEIIAYNEKCAQQEKTWNDAWQNWKDTIFLHSFQEDINGEMSRIFDSAFECIKQVSTAEFENSEVVEQEDSANINELEQLIARRKDEYR